MPRKKIKIKNVADLEQQGSKEISPEKLERLRAWGFQKGKSGNPGGMPPGTVRLSTAIQAVANRVNDKTGLTHLQTLLTVMFIEAIEGNQETRQILFDRGWGTLLQKNVIMQLGSDMLKIAKGLGLDEDDLSGSPTLRGLLQASDFDTTDPFGAEETLGREESAPPEASSHDDSHS